nr:hypothetical protein [Tanacetum cinerariifolium]
MANLSEYIQCVGFDTKPPMLDRTDFASWQQWIRLYCLGKENRVNILKSIDEGPFQMGTLKETLTEGTEVKLNRGLRDSNYDQLYAYLKQHEDRQNRGQGNNARGAAAAGYGGAQNIVGYANPGKVGQIKCYNYNGIGHIVRNFTQPKRPQNSEYFKDKMLLMQAQENEDLALNADNVFQADDCDAFDYDDAVCEHHEVYEMHDDVQPNYVVDSHTSYMSDSNMILYDQYVKDNAVQVVQSDVFVVPNDAYMMILNDMHKPPAQQKEKQYLEEFLDMKALKEKVEDKLFKQDQSLQTVHMLCKPKPYYDEQRKAAIGYKSPLCLTGAKQV